MTTQDPNHKARWWEYFMTKATRAYWHSSREAGQSLSQTLHGYVYGRWPALYIGLIMGRHPLAKPFVPLERWLRRKGVISQDSYARFVDGYHGKVLEPGAARQLIDVQRPIAAALPEKMLPYPRARSIILEAGDAVALMECPCRVSKKNHCLPLDVCIVVGKVMVNFVLTHHKFKARRVSPEQALKVIAQSQRRGHAAHAFFKDAVLDRFYTICNCCPCCCAAIESHKSGTPTLASSGLVVRLNASGCTGCGLCVRRCPFGAVHMEKASATVQENGAPAGQDNNTEDAIFLPRIDNAACMGCGVCAFNCPGQALQLVPAPERGMPLRLPEKSKGEA